MSTQRGPGNGSAAEPSLALHLPLLDVLVEHPDGSQVWQVAYLTFLVLCHADRWATGTLDRAGHRWLDRALRMLPTHEPARAALADLLALCDIAVGLDAEMWHARLTGLADMLERGTPDRPPQSAIAAHVRDLARHAA